MVTSSDGWEQRNPYEIVLAITADSMWRLRAHFRTANDPDWLESLDNSRKPYHIGPALVLSPLHLCWYEVVRTLEALMACGPVRRGDVSGNQSRSCKSSSNKVKAPPKIPHQSINIGAWRASKFGKADTGLGQIGLWWTEGSQNEDRLHAGNIASLQEHPQASRRLAKTAEIRWALHRNEYSVQPVV